MRDRSFSNLAACFGKMIEGTAIAAEAHRIGPQLQNEVMQFGCRNYTFDEVVRALAKKFGG